MFVHTAHGRGQIVEEQSVRGRKSFLVEGSGFKVWIDEKDLRVANDVNDDNSTTLPYDPTPQHPASMFGETSTIQPINEVDADERLSPTDSLSFDSAEDYPYPGPSADNFARSAARDYSYDEYLDYSHRNGMHPGDDLTADRYAREHGVPLEVASDYAMQHDNGSRRHADNNHDMEMLYGEHSAGETVRPPKNYRGKHRPPPAPEMYLPGEVSVWDSTDWADAHPDQTFDDPREQKRYEEWKEKYHGQAEFGEQGGLGYEPIYASKESEFGGGEPDERFAEDEEIKHFSNRHHANPAALLGLPAVVNSLGLGLNQMMNPDPVNQAIDALLPADLNRHLYDDQWSPGHFTGRPGYASLYQRPAGLSDKYIRIEAHTNHSDPVQQFRDDPVGFIQKRGYMYDSEVDIRLAEYVDLVEADPGIRTAAWRDVRSKALRLRREGKVHVKDISPVQIYASVDGDSDTYETMIVKGAGAKGQSIADWHCSCPWGRWAFKRQMSYVGRLCSHGYASFLEMESQHMKSPSKYGPKRKSAGIVDEFKKWAEEDNDGMIDQGALDDFVYVRNSEDDAVSENDVDKLYDALGDLETTGGHRNFDVGYEFDLDKVYKEADVLHLRPQSLTPDFYSVESEEWDQVDVTKDERKTTGPDNMVKESGYFGDGQENDWRDEGYHDDEDDSGTKKESGGGIFRMLFSPHTARRLTGRELHYASDEELGEAVKSWAGASSDLEKLRNLSAEEPDYQNKREQNDQIREVVEELHDRGIDASQFVASLRYAEEESGTTETEEEEKKKKSTDQPVSDQPSMSGAPNQTGQPGGSSSIEKTETAGSGALSNPTKDPASVGYNGMPGQQMGNPGTGGIGGLFQGIDADDVMQGLGSAATGLINSIPSVMQALPGVIDGMGQIGGQIGSGISNLVNGLSRQASFPEEEGREPFQGSGPSPKLWMGSSECWIDDNERSRFVDVTDLDEDEPIIKYTEKTGYTRRASEGANPDGSTLTSADSLVTGTGVSNLDQPFKAGSREAASDKPWDGHRVKDFARFVRQQGGSPSHQMLQEYLSQPHRKLDQGGIEHLQDFTSYAEQHQASVNNSMDMMGGGVADIPGSSDMSADVPGEPLEMVAAASGDDESRYRDGVSEMRGKPWKGDWQGQMAPDDDGDHGNHMKSGSYDDDNSDIVRSFQANIGNTALGNGAGGGGNFSDAAIAQQAQGFLRTAGRVYSLAEQRDLENESHPSGARNLKDLDLKGTHYEDAL